MPKRFLVILIAGLMFCRIPSANADPYEDGKAAYDAKDYETALARWRPLAEQGHAEAQLRLGFMYLIGRGVELDYAEARKWYLRAAQQGKARGMYNMGQLYSGGRGVPVDLVKAWMWWDITSLANDDAAYAWLGATSRDRFGKLMTAEQIAEARRLSAEWRSVYGQ